VIAVTRELWLPRALSRCNRGCAAPILRVVPDAEHTGKIEDSAGLYHPDRARLLPHGAAFRGIPFAARLRHTGQGARPEGSRCDALLGCAAMSGRVDQVGQVSRLIPLGIARTSDANR
jgi:hypothetical protein